MNKETWVRHIEVSGGITRPTKTFMADIQEWRDWHLAVRRHRDNKCQICIERSRTRRAVETAKAKRKVYADLGMKRVKGALE